MWANLCCNKYGHSRVPTLKTHFKWNNDILKIISAEEHLPRHMRIGVAKRIIRFLFLPICLLSTIAMFNYTYDEKDIYQRCQERKKCLSYCQSDNFPNLSCTDANYELTYKGNHYTQFYHYTSSTNAFFEHCKGLVQENAITPVAYDSNGRVWRTQVCFNGCRRAVDCLIGFSGDTRPECTPETRNFSSLVCLKPETECENYVKRREMCLNDAKTMCVDWAIVFLAILVTDALQLVFEASMLFALETTYKPTTVEKMSNPEKFKEDELNEQTNPEQKKEPDCNKILYKCCGELFYITTYLVVLFYGSVALMYNIMYGKPQVIVIEFLIAFVIDQAKSLLTQPLLWWTVVRRCGKYKVQYYE